MSLNMFRLQLLRPLCSAGQNSLCNFGRDITDEELFCEIILNLNQWFEGSRLKLFIFSMVDILISGVEQFMQFL